MYKTWLYRSKGKWHPIDMKFGKYVRTYVIQQWYFQNINIIKSD